MVIEQVHHPGEIFRVDQVFPGQHTVFQAVGGVAKHCVPATVAVDEAGVGVPVPDAIAGQVENRLQHVFIEVHRMDL
ncbi:hypothetical protein D3C85_1889640 [compost metagenome]